MKKLFILGLLCLLCFIACNHESNLSQSDNSEISENEDTPKNDDLSNGEPSITLSEEKEENNGFDFETYLNSNDILSITQVSLGDEGDKHCSAYEFLYKSDECKVVGFISIPNECIEKKIPYPCMIYNRGGNRDFGSIDSEYEQYIAYISYYFNRVVIASQYRGGPGCTGKDEFGGDDLNDVIKLIDMAENFDFVHMDDLCMMGDSRGGMMSYMAVRKDDRIKKLIINSGISDLVHLYDERTDMKSLLNELIGGSPKKLPDEYEKRSAINWADEINVPVLIFHSKGDVKVAFSQSQSMANALKESRKDCTFITHDDNTHASLHEEDWETIRNWLNGEKEKQ